MSSVSSASSSSLLTPQSNWLADTMTAIKNSQSQGGVIGMLQNAGDGSTASFLASASAFSNNLATIASSSMTNTSSFYAQLASQALQKQNDVKLQRAIEELQRQQNAVKPENVLDTYIYFDNGSTLNTETNVLTMSDGTQIDAITGAKVIDPENVIQMGNGSWLDTKNNILTTADGTQYDTVTGLKLSDLKALEDGESDSTTTDTSSTDTSSTDTSDTPPSDPTATG
jgi:hypothetical protein